MNGDGSPEIIATSSLTSLIYAGMSFAMVYENHRGTFGPRLDFQTGAIPAQLIATDLDGDRDMDIVTADYNPYTYYAVQQQSSVSILENLGGKRLAAASDNFVPGSSVYDFDYPTRLDHVRPYDPVPIESCARSDPWPHVQHATDAEPG